jgi:hypothetical protein
MQKKLNSLLVIANLPPALMQDSLQEALQESTRCPEVTRLECS